MKIPDDSSNNKYGIVVDSGSSGSRIQVYKWEDQTISKKSKDAQVLNSLPKITQEPNWSLKISPGISSYNEPSKIKEIWPKHFTKLMKFAQDIIPPDKHDETPVFVLATAGMRLLSPSKQKGILKEICFRLQKHTNFYIPNCQDFIQIIDGETEGIYGWLGLNYLMDQFDHYDKSKKEHDSIGFMDMGGASTQIAFVPSSSEEIEKHKEDLSKVVLRMINGDNQEWNVFVESWLGFGANEARKRYLNQLINLSIINPNPASEINDPCLPHAAEVDYKYEGKTYKIKGIGNYEMCLKTIYPLLLKHIPCKDTPCLFNGIHGPKLDFDKDKFIGISEYWYTANDIFHSGGEYNYHSFNEKVREYCESDWSQILSNSKEGQYSNLDPDKFLKDACFKASWVINILHEGFELPRLGIELPDQSSVQDEKMIRKIDKVHVPFKSADSVNGEELSWTLGKILLFASSQIESPNRDDMNVGIYPSEISGKGFVPGGASLLNNDYDDESGDEHDEGSLIFLLVFSFLLLFFLYHFGKNHFSKFAHKFRRFHLPLTLRRHISSLSSRIPIINAYFDNEASYSDYSSQNNLNIHLEEGLMSTSSNNSNSPSSSVLRTRSNISLADNDGSQGHYNDDQGKPSIRTYNNFINKPFIIPKKSPSNIYFQFAENNSRETLERTASNSSIHRTKNII